MGSLNSIEVGYSLRLLKISWISTRRLVYNLRQQPQQPLGLLCFRILFDEDDNDGDDDDDDYYGK